MTLQELDDGLRKLGLNLDDDSGKEIRNNIVRNYGLFRINSKNERCRQCSFRASESEKRKINQSRDVCENCDMNGVSSDPLQAGLDELNDRYNGIDLLSFVIMFVIPEYERVTGRTGTMDAISKSVLQRMKKMKKIPT